MKFRPIGTWVAVNQTDIGAEKKTDSGVIYKDTTMRGHFVVSKVVGVGDGVKSDIKVGDLVHWELATNRENHYQDLDLVQEEHIALVERNGD